MRLFLKETFYYLIIIVTMSLAANSQKKSSAICTDKCEAKNKKTELTCKLTTPELSKRKATVIAGLKKQLLQKKELINGYAYKFKGTDAVLDELASFIKTERACCDFFVYSISISGDKSEAWLSLTGPAGVKDFIKTELEF
jgi:hypothetical protein